MVPKKILLAVTALLLSFSVVQSQKLPIDRNTQKGYLKHTRDLSGLPGKAYWQNRGDYSIGLRFDPNTRRVEGTVSIDYVNNSPDTLI